MSDDERVPNYIKQNITSMLARPLMWGTYEAVELQVLTLLGVWLFGVREDLSAANAMMGARREYDVLLREWFPEDRGKFTAAKSLADNARANDTEFREFMEELCERVFEQGESKPEPIRELLRDKHIDVSDDPPPRAPLFDLNSTSAAAE